MLGPNQSPKGEQALNESADMGWVNKVLRMVRFIIASPSLEGFGYKIFGPVKKHGSLIIFTICLLIISYSLLMQLLCFLCNFNKFETFDEAFMSMFQILKQEAWVKVKDVAMVTMD